MLQQPEGKEVKDINSIIKKIELEQALKGEVFPCTIVMDRYNGTYSGAAWLAFNADTEGVPYEIGSSDPDEMIFWREYNASVNPSPVGKGDTPDDAYADLVNKVIEWNSK